MLCKVFKEIKTTEYYTPQITESQDVLGTSEEKQSEIPMWVSPIRTQVSGEALDLGTPEFNGMAKTIGYIAIEFSHMHIYKVYAMKNVAFIEMKVREGSLIK